MSANKPNISQIRKYLNGELDARAMHKLEREALDDPFLMDALEGYGRTGKEQQPNLEDLQRRLNKRTAPAKKRMLLWPTISIAASVLLFIAAGGWWVVNYRAPANKPYLPGVDNTVVKSPLTAPDKNLPVRKADTIVVDKDKAAELKPANAPLSASINKPKSSVVTRSAKFADPTVRIDEPVGNAPVTSAVVEENRKDSILSFKPAMQGYIAGVESKKLVPGASPDIRIRGVGSVSKSEPLYIVDGKIYNGKLDDINPNDISNVSVLQDAASVAIYGSRAANGVVLVTTKKGKAKSIRDSTLLAKNRLKDVIIMGYSTQKRTDITGSVSSVVADSLKKVPAVQIEQALQGRLAGVQVTRGRRPRAADTLRLVKGKVLSKDDGQPLPGVSITVPGKNEGTQTDANGYFKIKASGKDELNIAYVGFESQRVKVKGTDSVNLVLKGSSSSLAEVVVTGYGTHELEEKNAEPVKGWSEFKKYLAENAGPVAEKTGVVRLSFMVNANGILSDFKILRSLNLNADAKAIELIKHGPKWTPNTNGKPEKVTVRVKFKKK